MPESVKSFGYIQKDPTTRAAWRTSMKRSLIVVLVFFTLSVLASAAGDGGADVYIVYMEPPLEGEKGDPEAYHIRTLASVLGRWSSIPDWVGFCLF